MAKDSSAAQATQASPSSGSSGEARPKRLGRGLSALLSTPVPIDLGAGTQVSIDKQSSPTGAGAGSAAPPVEAGRSGGPGTLAHRSSPSERNEPMPASTPVLLLEVGDIEPSPFQPRREFDTAALDSLGESIRTAGLMQPIIVRPSSRGSGRRYELVAGERRWRAVTRAGLGRLPAIVRSLSDAEAAEWAVVENLQREDLNPIERAEAFATLTGRFGLSHMDVATKVGLDRSSVTNFLRLLELEEPIRKLLSAGRLSFGHGRALLSAPAGSARVGLACDAAENSWSVRTLERAALSLARGGGAVRRGEVSETRAAREAARADLERQLSAHLGSKVILRPDRNGKKGRIVIEFYGLDHLDGLLSKLGYSPARGS